MAVIIMLYLGEGVDYDAMMEVYAMKNQRKNMNTKRAN